MELARFAFDSVLASGGNQLAGTFLAPQSTFSIGALACSLAVLLALALRSAARRSVAPRVLHRALFPDRIWRSASGRVDIAFFVFGLLFAGLAWGWAIISADQVRASLQPWLGAPGPQRLPVSAAAAIVMLALFLAYELAYWFDHWLMHRVPLLWRFHKVHHQAESLSFLTNFRVHPVETVLFAKIKGLFLGTAGALLQRSLGEGVSPWTLGGTNLLVMAFAVVLNHLQHSHLWIGFGPRWGRLLLGPAHHQIHHSADPAHFDRNLGSSLALFDRLFDTFYLPDPVRERLRFGVDDGEGAPHGLRATLFAPFLPSPRPVETPARAPA